MDCKALKRTFSAQSALLLAACVFQSARSSIESASLKGHNSHRKAAGLQELSWDSQLASSADQWAKKLSSSCSLQHTSLQQRQQQGIGENLYMYGGKRMSEDEVAQRGCQSWHAEVKDYQYPGGNQPYDACGGSFGSVGHLTQMMWEKTTKLGCAVAQCPNGYLYACHYSPPGNFMGQAMFQDENFLSVCKREPGWRSCGKTQCGQVKGSKRSSAIIETTSAEVIQLVVCAAIMLQI
ncbi:uncharacterized protein LOC142338372 isoform X2 [Convolutriloba macropyga]|uniref:uncharacterized protein LOC142338372 isoform X2 n=1 Tax=Convolutriloba macropyga TaxID=536237 RepID=UPI003F528CEF